jgi:hypothetical protein
MSFFPVARRFITWRALSLTLFFMLLLSLLWEATLAVPARPENRECDCEVRQLL